MMLMASGVNHGIRKSLPHYFGICIGFPAMVALVGFGMGALLSAHPTVFLVIKVVGLVYLLYLAWKVGNSGNPKASKEVNKPFSFVQATLFQWLNPKAWVISVSGIAAFTTHENFGLSVVFVTAVYFFMGFFCMGIWLKLGQGLQEYLSEGRRRHYFNISMGVMLALSVIPMAFAGLDATA